MFQLISRKELLGGKAHQLEVATPLGRYFCWPDFGQYFLKFKVRTFDRRCHSPRLLRY